MKGKIAVTGASGWLGSSISRRLEQAGESVLKFSRRSQGPGCRVLDFSDTGDDGRWVKCLEGVDTIVHCAAHVHKSNETAAERRLFEQINVRGVERLGGACKKAGVRRIVLASSIAVYGPGGGAASEESELRPLSAYGESKKRAEEVVQSLFPCWSILRISTIYGTGDHANFSKLAKALKKGVFVLPGRGTARKSVVGIDEIADFVVQCIVPWAGENGIYNVAEAEAPTIAEICDKMSMACGFAKPKAVPLPLLKFGALLGDAMQALTGSSPLTTRSLGSLTADTAVDTTKLATRWPDFKFGRFASNVERYAPYYQLI